MQLQPGDLEIGAMFWAGRDPLETIHSIKNLGVRSGQLGIPGDMNLDGAATPWKAARDTSQFSIATVFCAYCGEDYADIPTVQKTVGFIPRATRQEREARTIEVSEFAAALGVKSIACHIGFVPEDKSDPDYIAVRDMVRRICAHAAGNGQTFALETGQEPAAVLLEFLRDCNCPNLKVNFDPANMILYGSGDPIEAVKILAPHVVSVHCKDGNWPPKDQPGALGTEMPLGQGEVGIDRFIDTLKAVGYKGTLNIEREGQSPEQWTRDVKMAVALLERLRAA